MVEITFNIDFPPLIFMAFSGLQFDVWNIKVVQYKLCPQDVPTY